MNVFLTLDYELFMGGVQGTVRNSLIDPVSHLLDVLNPYGIKTTFFVDAAYLYRISVSADRCDKAARDFEITKEHIRFLAQHGHSIQMHFHPQWLYSDIVNNCWVMDYVHYKISDMAHDDFEYYFTHAFHLLQSLLGTPIKAFRAGGYTIGDNIDFLNVFHNLGITIDSSVLRGGKADTMFQNYNYKRVPSKGHYRFETSMTQESKDGRFIEYPISAYEISPLYYIVQKKQCIRKDKSKKWGDGIGVACKLSKKQRLKNIFVSFLSKKVIPASIDTPFSSCLEKNFNNCISQGYNEMVIIGHPKNLSPGSLADLQLFIERHPDLLFRVFA